MKFHILTLFPEMILQGLRPGIIGRAAEKGIISLNAVNIRDYTEERHGKVDDYPYGGGAGMLLQAQPVYAAHRAVTGGRRVRTIYMTPQGVPLTQKTVRELAGEEELIFLCGHYEGIDERVLEEIVTDSISIGDYVLTGGELAAMVVIDAVSRLVPGVLGNEDSPEEESFFNDLLEYPQYSRPESWHGKSVPAVLLSGNHREVAAWRLEEARKRTALRRPDLYERYQEKQRLIRQLSKDKRNNIHMMESLARGKGEILYADAGNGMKNAAIYDGSCRTAMLMAGDAGSGRRLAELLPAETERVLVSQAFLEEILEEKQYRPSCRYRQVLYPQRTVLPVKHKDIRRLGMESYEYVCARYCDGTGDAGRQGEARRTGVNRQYVKERILAGAVYGIFVEEEPVGFGGYHADGGLGMLYLEENSRRKGLGTSLEAYIINRMLERGWIPYGHVEADNMPAMGLQEKLGLYFAAKTYCRMEKTLANEGQVC